ncbi:MAG: hypothetical protein ABI559_10360 [Chloroflexota bacterium]
MAIQPESLTKRKIMESLATLPENATVEDFQERLTLLTAVAEGLEDIEAGRVIPHEEMVKRVKQWLE